MLKSSNIDICSTKFSILSRAGLSLFHPANFSPPQPEILSVSYLVQCCFTPKNKTHLKNVFHCCFWAKTEPQEQKTVSGVRSQRRRKNVSQCCFNPKTDLAGERTFFPMRRKIRPSGINEAAPKGEEKVAQCFFKQKQTHRKRNKCPTANPFHHILIYYPFTFFKFKHLKGKNSPHLQEYIFSKTFTF